MPEGAGGFLVDSVEECAEKLLYLPRNPAEGEEMVGQSFLLTDELALYASLLGAR